MINDFIERTYLNKMTFYRETYKNRPRWNGRTTLKQKTVIIYCEQGFGDIIQFYRYFPLIANQCKNLILHCPKELHRLFKEFECIDKRDSNLPNHDYHVLSMSLPFLLKDITTQYPYLNATPKEVSNKLKIGIAWEGNPDHSNNDERNCPLYYFDMLTHLPDVQLFMVQQKIHTEALACGINNMEIFQTELNDFYDTAEIIQSMDFIVSVDTSVLHLAGALGKRSYGLLSFRHDSRWDVKNWYPSVRTIAQKSKGDWEGCFQQLKTQLGEAMCLRD